MSSRRGRVGATETHLYAWIVTAHWSQVSFTEVMSSRILMLCSLWAEDARSACKLQHLHHSRACFEQGLAKWEETLSIHHSDLCLQRAVRSSSNPEIPLSIVATPDPEAEEIKCHWFSSLDLQLPCLKAPCNIWETFFPLPNLFPGALSNPAGYRIQRGWHWSYSSAPGLVDLGVSRHAVLSFCVLLAVTISGSPTALCAALWQKGGLGGKWGRWHKPMFLPQGSNSFSWKIAAGCGCNQSVLISTKVTKSQDSLCQQFPLQSLNN